MAVRFILASGSPRRKELLSGLLSDFEVIVPQTKELTEHHHGPGQLSLSNAWLKAKAVAENYFSDWVLGSDTVVAIGNKSFGKPVDIVAARNMLWEFSGKSHEVHTGMCLINQSLKILKKQVVTSRVTFLDLNDSIIEKYFSSVNPLDKAGGYAIQTRPDLIIDSLEGSCSNVIGLPIERLREWLLELQILPSTT